MHNSDVLDFSFLDQPDFRTKYGSGPEKDQIRFYVQGISCSKCVRKLESLPQEVPGLRTLRVEFGKNLAYAEIDSRITTFQVVAKKIEALGFKPIPLSPSLGEEENEKAEDRAELIRLAVAGACAGNIMTFSFATYFGDTQSLYSIFAWLSFVLYLPVLAYVAQPFYRGAWNSLKQRQISIDLPMAVASLAGFIFSTVELLRGQTDIYFDSISGFLFLILLSRWAQRRLQRRFLKPQEMAETLQLGRARLMDVGNQRWSWTLTEKMGPGAVILVFAGETLSADAELVSESANFSLAWISGEAVSKTFLRGAVIRAGARLVAGEAQLRIQKPLIETTFGKILTEVQKFSMAKVRIVTSADRWAQWLLGLTFLAAVTFLVAYWPISPEEAIRRSLALIILACPCAMAFGTPLALASALRRAQRRGLIVRNAGVFERARTVKTIFFDKTGTLTETDLILREPVAVPRMYQSIVLALENRSSHPIAFAFRKAFSDLGILPTVHTWHEIPGRGVSGYVQDCYYELRSAADHGGFTTCTLFRNQSPIYKFTFECQVKPDTYETLEWLRSKGYRVALISGDARGAVDALATRLGFRPDDVFAECTPEVKAKIIAENPHAMMVGDGINDSLALMAASASVAASACMEAALKCSDVFLVNSSLDGIRSLLTLSRACHRLIRQNLLISGVYNATAGALALSGFINPFVAAVLMPVSSGFILVSTWWGSRR